MAVAPILRLSDFFCSLFVRLFLLYVFLGPFGSRCRFCLAIPTEDKPWACKRNATLEAKCASAPSDLGICFECGWGTTQNLPRAAAIYRQEVASGGADGQIAFAPCLKNRLGVPDHAVESARYLQLAAEQEHPVGQFKYGWLLVQTEDSDGFQYIKLAADSGHAKAQAKYGVFLAKGWGVEKDAVAAARYLKLAADQGLAFAQFEFGTLARVGMGVEQSNEEAARYFKLAADQGLAQAQFSYAIYLRRGVGVPRDDPEAARYFKLVADQGSDEAQYTYGRFLENGVGVDEDIEAAKYIKMAAEHGHVEVLFKMGEYYEQGMGVPESRKDAARYYRLAADKGKEEAEEGYACCAEGEL
jgi:TPR repeat protein